ncbi:Chaperone protein DnaJ [subsurface metagenome]
MKDLSLIERKFEEYERRIQQLKQFEMELLSLDIKGFDSGVLSIRRKLKDPRKVDELEKEFTSLRKKVNEEIENLILEADNIIENAKREAIKAKNSFWLSALEIFEEDFHRTSQEIKSGRFSLKDALAHILDLREEAEALNIPPPEEKEVTKENYYDILGIKHDASSEQIKDIYRRLSLIYHPDTGKHFGVDGEQRFKEIKEAYETLIDPDKRREYNKKIGM